MYVINSNSIYLRLQWELAAMTRCVNTPDDIIAGVAANAMWGFDLPAVPRDLYVVKKRFVTGEYTTDNEVLTNILKDIVPEITEILKKHFPTTLGFSGHLTSRAGQIIFLTNQELDRWRSVYGNKNIISSDAITRRELY